MKFLHTADIHLDSPLLGLARRGDIPEHVTRHCTRRAFANAVDLAISQDVAFVVIAGDLYDGDWKDYSTGLFFAEQMRRLAPRPCFVVHGNHDAASVLTRTLTLPGNVHLFDAHRPETKRVPGLDVVLHGQSFPTRAVLQDLSDAYPPAQVGQLNIGVLHTSAEDPGEHETYAPCRIERLAAKNYDYWALGHIHQRAVLHETPWIVFPGNTQGRHVRETGAKGCVVAEVEDRRIVAVRQHAVDVLRWADVVVDADQAEELTDLAARLRFALDGVRTGAEGRPLITRVTVRGATNLHAALLAEAGLFEAECRNAAANIGPGVFIERARLATRPIDEAEGESTSALLAAFRAGLADDRLIGALAQEFARLAGELPRLPGMPGAGLPATEDEVRALADDAWQIVRHALAREQPA